MESEVGKKIKALRGRKKKTLKSLGDETGLSISYLSQVERGISRINITSLGKIANALGVGMDFFLDPPTTHESGITRFYEQTLFMVNNAKFYYSRLGNGAMKGRLFEPVIVCIHPNSNADMIEPGGHDGEEFIYVLEGILTLCMGNERIPLYPGDSAHYDPTTPHEWANLTSKMVRLLAVNTPVLFQD